MDTANAFAHYVNESFCVSIKDEFIRDGKKVGSENFWKAVAANIPLVDLNIVALIYEESHSFWVPGFYKASHEELLNRLVDEIILQ